MDNWPTSGSFVGRGHRDRGKRVDLVCQPQQAQGIALERNRVAGGSKTTSPDARVMATTLTPNRSRKRVSRSDRPTRAESVRVSSRTSGNGRVEAEGFACSESMASRNPVR